MEAPSAEIAPPIARIILYVRDIPKVAAFYQLHFGLVPQPGATPGWQELASPSGGCSVALHQAAVSQKSGAAMKLVFSVADVPAFKAAAEKQGLKFGVIHDTGEHQFCNAKDPAGNSISISSRGITSTPKQELEPHP